MRERAERGGREREGGREGGGREGGREGGRREGRRMVRGGVNRDGYYVRQHTSESPLHVLLATDRQQTDTQTDRHTDRQTHRQTDRQTDRRRGRQAGTDRQTDRLTDTCDNPSKWLIKSEATKPSPAWLVYEGWKT